MQTTIVSVGLEISLLTILGCVNAILQKLFGMTGSAPPSMDNIAELVRKVGQRYIREVMSDFQAIVFGWCIIENRYRALSLEADPDASPRQLRAVDHPLYQTDYCALLGSTAARNAAGEEISRILKQLEGGHPLKRAPKRALEAMVGAESTPGVGGSLQVGAATQRGFELTSYVQPVEPGKPLAKRSVLGIDIDKEIGTVGQYHIGMTGTT